MQCPQCHNDVLVTEAHYGALYTCPKCMAVYFINFDGHPEYGDMENITSEPSPEILQPITTEAESATETSDPLLQNFDLPLDSQHNNDSAFFLAAQEITDYGNQEEIISNINYDVYIKGLDTKEVMIAFKESIDDSKFAWLTQDIVGQIKGGEIKIKNLNPIQAFVLAQRIQFLDLEIEWKQNVAF